MTVPGPCTPRRRPRPRRCGGPHRSVVAACAAVVTALLLGACTSLPEAGAPQPFDVSVPVNDPVGLAASGPSKGADPEDLVAEFLLAAAAGPTDDFATARLFLTESEGSSWDPTAQVQVYSTDSTPSITVGGDTSGTDVTVTAPAVATVGADGVMDRPASGASVTGQFRVTQVDGEWRISGLDDGVIVSESSFAASYRLVNLYFPSSDGQVLVADPRWYPTKRLATHLLTGLVAGPDESVAPAVLSAMPEGASVPSQGIDISDQVAHVDLEGFAPASVEQQRLLAWQVSATLTQATAVSSVDLEVSGTTIPMADLPTGPVYRMESAVVSNADGFSTLTGTSLRPLLTRTVIGQDATRPAISPAGESVVGWVSGAGVTARRVADGAEATQEVSSPTWPSVDRLGWVWTAPSKEAGAAWTVLSADGQTASLASPFTDSSTPEALRVSPDGSRVVIVRRIGDELGVWVAPVRRDSAGVPEAVGTAVAVPGLDEGVLDVSWAGSSTIVALHHTQSGTELVVVPLGGWPTTLSAPSASRHVTAGATSASVQVQTSDGSVLSRSGSVWQPVTAEIQEIEFPG